MLSNSFCIFFFFLWITSEGAEEKEKEEDTNLCVFNGVLNSTTFDKFPTEFCIDLSGNIILDETTDLTETQITDISFRFYFLNGSLIIRNTTYEYLPLSYFRLDGNNNGTSLIIENNALLKTIDLPGSSYGAPGYCSIKNNPELVVDCRTIQDMFFQKRTLLNNKNDCGCELESPLNEENLLKLPNNCSIIYGNITLNEFNDISFNLLSSKLQSTEIIYGCVVIENTKYENLSFLSSLKIVSWKNTLMLSDDSVLKIKGNQALKKLSWTNLQIVDNLNIVIDNNPNLCLSYKEHMTLADSYFTISLPTNICEDSELEEGFYRSSSKNIEDIPPGTTVLIGDLILDEHTDIRNIFFLSNLTTIYGRIVIDKATFRTLNFLWNLEYLFSFSGEAASMEIKNNPLLEVIYFRKFSKILGNMQIVIQNNSRLPVSAWTCENLVEVSSGNFLIAENYANCFQDPSYINSNSAGFQLKRYKIWTIYCIITYLFMTL